MKILRQSFIALLLILFLIPTEVVSAAEMDSIAESMENITEFQEEDAPEIDGDTSTFYEGDVLVNEAESTASTMEKPVYRLYNRRNGEHFYTLNLTERYYLINSGWVNEGIGWFAPDTSSTPVYRLLSLKSYKHHYTTSQNERDVLVKLGSWRYEGISWYSDDKKSVPLYRQYNRKSGDHHYTADANEYHVLTTKYSWNAEGIAWYATASTLNRDLMKKDMVTKADIFLLAAKNVATTAHNNGYKYGDSRSVIPTADGKISCDRLIAKALWDMGYKNQPVGGITCGNMEHYLKSWGFTITYNDFDQIRPGAIVMVNEGGNGSFTHAFVSADNWHGFDQGLNKYDAGSQRRIDNPNILQNDGSWWYGKTKIAVITFPGC